MEPVVTIRTFLQVIEHGSFSAAARAADVAVSSITRQIDALEKHLGTPVLIRSTHSLTPTEAGLTLIQHARTALSDIDDAIRHIQGLDHQLSGKIVLTAPMTFGQKYLTPLLPTFLNQYPALHVDIRLTDNYLNLIQEGVDIAVRVGEHEVPDLILHAFLSNAHVACAAPAYLAKHGAPTHPDQLKQHACLIHHHKHSELGWSFFQAHQQMVVFPQGPLATDNSLLLIGAAVAGLGIVLMPVWAIIDELDKGELVPILNDWQVISPFGSSLYFATPPHRRQAEKVRVLRSFLMQAFADLASRSQKYLPQEA